MTPNVFISHITLFSKDIDKTAEFYNTIGLNLSKSGNWNGYSDYLDILESNGQKVFFKVCPTESESKASTGLGFRVGNVAKTLQKLIELGYEVTRPGNPRIYKYATIATVIDPDGRNVGLYQHER